MDLTKTGLSNRPKGYQDPSMKFHVQETKTGLDEPKISCLLVHYFSSAKCAWINKHLYREMTCAEITMFIQWRACQNSLNSQLAFQFVLFPSNYIIRKQMNEHYSRLCDTNKRLWYAFIKKSKHRVTATDSIRPIIHSGKKCAYQ